MPPFLENPPRYILRHNGHELLDRSLPIAPVLPEQFVSPQKYRGRNHGAAALMVAILADAIDCYQHQFTRSGEQTRRLAKEAEEWLFEDEMEWPFSFLNICEALDLDSTKLRRTLIYWREYPPVTGEKGLRHVVVSRRLAGPSASDE